MTQTQDKLSEHISVKEAQMAEVLAKIVRDKYLWLEEHKSSLPLSEFKGHSLHLIAAFIKP